MNRLLLMCSTLALGLVAPVTVSGQSLFNAAGLGVPTDAHDARARSLGGLGIGLRGAALMGSDPAAAAHFVLPTVIMTAQPAWVDYERQDIGEAGSFRGTRWPVLGIAYPTVRGMVATFSFESFLDQRYESASPTTLSFNGSPVEVRDEFESRGGVSQVRLGVARRFGSALAVGVSASRYSGSVTQLLTRTFQSGVDTTAVESFQDGGLWSYSGVGLTGGASLSMGAFAHVSGSATWSSGLDATASDDTDGDSRSYDLPLQLRLGATAVLAPGLSVSAGYTSADWSSLDSDLRGSVSTGTSSSMGVGVELARARLFGRNAPLRFGYRKADLPFALGTGEPAETVWTAGLGLNLSQVGELVRARVDLAIERGDRSDSALLERFWRGSITVRVSGL